MNRPFLICLSRAPMCPRCERRLHRIHINSGSMFTTCSSRPPRTGLHRRSDEKRCGQRVHIHGTDHGICYVTGLTKDEYDRYTGKHFYRVEDLYQDLDLVATIKPLRSRSLTGGVHHREARMTTVDE